MNINPRFIDGLEFAKEQLVRNIDLEKSKKDFDDKKVFKMQDALMDLEKLIEKSNEITGITIG